MTDRTHASKQTDPSDELTQLAADSVTDLGHAHAAASVPGVSGHRREAVDTVFDDPRISGAEHVVVTVPRGDTEALNEVRSRLEHEHSRSAGATVIVEGTPSADASPPAVGHPRSAGPNGEG